MSKREALREFQARIVSRLQTARAQGALVASWLAVESAGQSYLVPLGHAGEIFPGTAVQPVPHTLDWFLGVANLRGSLVGVADLAALLHATPRRDEQALSEISLLTFNPALEVNAALLVDRLLGLRSAQDFIASEPPVEDGPSYIGTTYLDAQGARWRELNLQLLSQDPTFLSINA